MSFSASYEEISMHSYESSRSKDYHSIMDNLQKLRHDIMYYSVNTIDKRGNTFLHRACMYNCDDLVEELIKKGINVNLLNSKGLSALEIAYNNKNLHIIDLLVQANADTYCLYYKQRKWINNKTKQFYKLI